MFTLMIAWFAAAVAASSPDPLQTLEKLRAGNERYVKDSSRNGHQGLNKRGALRDGQRPAAVVLSCSDSRVPAELVFDNGVGDLFSVRVAGNLVGTDSLASIEYAVKELGARLIVVMGHDSCDAVHAAVTTPKGRTSGSPELDRLVKGLQANLSPKNQRSSAAGRAADGSDEKLRRESMTNVDAVAKSLVNRSKIIRSRVRDGSVSIVQALFSLETGKVEFWSEARKR